MAQPHCNLGRLLMRRGEALAEALDLVRRGHALGSKSAHWSYPSADWVREAEHAVALDAKLPLFLTDEARPVDTADALALARLCKGRGLYGAAARYYTDAFEDPTLANDLDYRNRYSAACAAALGGCGQGKDEHPPDAAARAELRRQAHTWLQSDLAVHARRLDAGTDVAREGVRTALGIWKSDRSLASVRDLEALEQLSLDEKEAWRMFWSQVDALLARAGGRPS
jgi:hypothetical protein